MITRLEILKGRDHVHPLTPELEANLTVLLERLNKLRQVWGKPMIVTSGYRPAEINALAGGALKSRHITCQAADISDPEHELINWLLAEPNRLKDFGFWMEHPEATKNWVHLQVVPPASGLRVFRVKPAQLLS